MTTKLQDYLVPEAVVLGMDADNAEEVIRNLGGKLLHAGFVRGTFVENVLSREKTIPTGLPLTGKYNAAIPHTDIHHVAKSGIGLATLTRSVAFHNMVAPDECVDVRLVFLLALDEPKSQVEMLQEIAEVLQNPELVVDLINSRNLFQVREALRKA